MYETGYQENAFGYAPGYDAASGAVYYGQEEAAAGAEGAVARLVERARGWAATVSGNKMFSIGAGALAGAWSMFFGQGDWVAALGLGLAVGGSVQAAASFIAGGFESLKSMGWWFTAAMIPVGAALPMIVDKITEKLGFELPFRGGYGYM